MMRFILILALALATSCSQFSNKKTEGENLYSKEFLVKIETIKELYKKGETEAALKSLESIHDNNLKPVEKSLKSNLIGVIYFSSGKFDDAEKLFESALPHSKEDPALIEQIKLNLSSTNFKQSKFDLAYNHFKMINPENLSDGEQKKYFNLQLALATHLNKSEEAMSALVNLLSLKKHFQELKESTQMNKLWEYFSRLTDSEKMRFLEKYEDEKYAAVAFLGFREAEKKMAEGDKEKAKNLLDWVDDNYQGHPEVVSLLDSLNKSKADFFDFESGQIGLVLPFSGEKSGFGRKAMMGIDVALESFFKQSKVTLNTKDSVANGAIGAARVKELIEQNKVAVIIGGLFPDEAVEEYLEAKKHGTMFISLSPINLPKDEKDTFLIEVTGSIESQVAALLSDSVIKNFGKRVGVFYPETSMGQAYVNEFFRLASLKGVVISQAQSYKKDTTDYREPVEKMLSLKLTKERKEEIDYLSSVYSNEKNASIKRVQVLNPIVDYDWLFLPAYPQDALQIIPLFNYYDASHIKYFGGPSWRSDLMVKNQPKVGSLNFVGEDSNVLDDTFSKKFYEKYKTYPKLIETISYDSLSIVNDLFNNNKIHDRSDLSKFLGTDSKLKGFTGVWNIQEGLWVKNLLPQKITRGDFEPIK